MDHIKFFYERIPISDAISMLTTPQFGTNAVFIGYNNESKPNENIMETNYGGNEKEVIESLEKACDNIRKNYINIKNIVLFKRLGTIPLDEANLFIGVSTECSDAIELLQKFIESLKNYIQIKKEIENIGGKINCKIEYIPLYVRQSKIEYTVKKKVSNVAPKIKLFKSVIKPEVKPSAVPSHLIQIKATTDEINMRIEKFMERKREEINCNNIRDFCRRNNIDDYEEFSCARIDSILLKRKDSVGHLQVEKVLNNYSRDQNDMEYLKKYIPKNGVEERLRNVEFQLSMSTPVPLSYYDRLKYLEDRLLLLESISPEYQQFWRKTGVRPTTKRKKTFSVEELDSMIVDLEKRRKTNV